MATQTGSQAVERAQRPAQPDRRVRDAAHLHLARRRARAGEVHDLAAPAGAGAQPAGAPRPGRGVPCRARCSPCTPPGPARCTTCSELARPTMEHLSELSPGDGEPRGAARRRGRPDRPGRQPLPARRRELGRRRRARALHGAGQGALRLRRAPAARSGNLERRTAHSPVDRAQFDHALVEVRRRGCAGVAGRAGARAHRRRRARARPSTARSSPLCRSPDRRTASTSYGITKLGDLLVAELRGLSALLGHQPR